MAAVLLHITRENKQNLLLEYSPQKNAEIQPCFERESSPQPQCSRGPKTHSHLYAPIFSHTNILSA